MPKPLALSQIANIRVAHRATLHSMSEYISPQRDGYIGHYNGGDIFIEVAPKDGKYIIFSQDQDVRKTLHPISSFAINGRRRLFEHIVRIYSDISGRSVTKYPTNHVKLVWVHLDRKGQAFFQLWEIAIVTQYDAQKDWMNFFLTTQLTNESQIYCDKSGNILIPDFDGFSNWDSLQYYMKMLVSVGKLPSIESRPIKTKEVVQEFEDNTGRVRWYNLAQQFGLVEIGKQGQVARVHWSQIESRERHKILEYDQMVRFDELIRPKQTTTRTTTVPWELRTVNVVV